MKEKKITKKQLAKDYKKTFDRAWKLWSEYRRKSEADENGLVVCFSCNAQIPWRRPKDKKQKGDFANLGHFFHGKLDFDPIATQIQDTYCNHGLHGNLGLYAIHLVEKYGLEKIRELVKRADVFEKYSIEELEQIIKDIEEKSCLKLETK